MGRALNPDITLCFRVGDAGGQLLSSFVRTPRLLKFPQTSKVCIAHNFIPELPRPAGKSPGPHMKKGWATSNSELLQEGKGRRFGNTSEMQELSAHM